MKKILFVIVVFFLSCSIQSNKNNNIHISIDRIRTRFDLFDETFIVRRNKGDYIDEFTLTTDEKLEIKRLYYDFEIDKIKSTFYGNCEYLPITTTSLDIQINDNISKIVIDENCEDFIEKNDTAKRVKAFIDCVGIILKSKPQVKNAPKSDIALF